MPTLDPTTPTAKASEPTEDPFPFAARIAGKVPVARRQQALPGPARRAAFCVPAIAAWSVAGAEPGFEAGGSLLYFAASLAGAMLAALGAIAATSLLGYSRTLLREEVADSEHHRDEPHAVHAEIARLEAEYLAVAFVYTVAGWILGLWALRTALAPEYYGVGLVAYGCVMLLVAGTLPAAVTQFRAERTVLAVRPYVRLGWWVLRWPLVLPLLALTRVCLWLLRIRAPKANDTAEVQKQVIAAVADSTAETLAGEERTWIGNIVALKDVQVSTIMTQRPDIVAFEAATPLHEAVQTALAEGFSRYPVYRERIDDVIGIFYVKDALRLLRGDDAAGNQAVEAMARETLFVPETMGAARLLRRFQAGHQHLAIVLDEYGSTRGIVSVEDVLEQIVGEIEDEYDDPAGAEPDDEQVTVVERGRVVELPGRTAVGEVNELLGTELPEDGDFETIAGLVIARSNRIPQQDEHVVADGLEFTVLDADDRRLKRLRVTVLAPTPAEEAG